MCKFKKAIYSLKESTRAWFDKFSHIIAEVRFQKCYSDYFVFFHKTSSDIVILVVYIDDILLTENDVDGIEKELLYIYCEQFQSQESILACAYFH